MEKLELDQVINVLRRTPALASAALKDLPEQILLSNEGSGTWSAFDVVGHLIHGEKTDWIPRIRIILEFGESRPFDPFDREAMLQTSKGKSIGALLDEFAIAREESLQTLCGLKLSESDLK